MSTVTFAVDGAVGRISLARPDSLNAVNAALSNDLGAAFAAANADPAVRSVLLTGEGRAFCAGADLKDPDTHSGDDLLAFLTPSLNGGLESVAACPKPVVVAVQGWCVGGGVEMVLSADVAVAADTARFFQPQVGLGIVPGAGGMARLVRRVGPTWATRMVMLGEKISAADAFRMGLVSEVVPADDLLARGLELANILAALAPGALRLAKDSLRESAELPMQAALRADRYRLFMLSETDEKKASHAAFAAQKAGK